ncbi:PH domain-containing protein [Psychrobacter arenosus]|uniref:PH domain-containing protein n=1 Tax=Psychrobacter arenosus TaxID=256326 RepID=UPI00191996F0|nr:PH domain-containing protein [Psychrobacter arenosus]
MTSYIDNNLTNGEVVVQKAKVSWWSQDKLIFLGIILLLAYGIGLIFLIAAYINVTHTEIALTNKRLIMKKGFIKRDTVELNLSKIEGLVVKQSMTGRLLNYGTLIVSGTGELKTPLPSISEPMEFKKAINEYLENR